MKLSKLKGKTLIVDCYTDEPSGLGVPPYLGVYPRLIYGAMKHWKKDISYITIDDLRLKFDYSDKLKGETYDIRKSKKTNINILHSTKNIIDKSIKELNEYNLIFIGGVHTPGKYLSAKPATRKEIDNVASKFENTYIYGPLIYGSGLYGGAIASKSKIEPIKLDIKKEVAFKKSYPIIDEIPWGIMLEIETGVGCVRKKGCSFCTEPFKNKVKWREPEDILEEIKNFSEVGVDKIRFGKQTCFYSYQNFNLEKITKLLKGVWEVSNPKVVHIDNANPAHIVTDYGKKVTELIVKYTTSGNIAAMGIESFDPVVSKRNNLNTNPEMAYKAIKIVNKYGKKRGKNGMPKFLPGLNLLFGLPGETKETHNYNMKYLNKLFEEDLLVRRINIREVVSFEDAPISNMKLPNNTQKYYWKWKNQIRKEIDNKMLKKIIPKGTVLKNVFFEVYDGKKSFGRQYGTYPIIVGIDKRVELNKAYEVKVTDHMLRSVKGEIINNFDVI
ncbi:MAG: radical SAM protein [Candidatus Woesearchaeota archaeon]